MKNVTIKFIYLATLLFWGSAVFANIIQPGMVDNFENGTTNSWVKGPQASSDLAPKNLANADESNRFLQVKSYGPGRLDRDVSSRMVFFNEKQWAGDYSSINSLSIDMKAESSTEEYLYMRLAIFDTAASGSYSRYVSTEYQKLVADGQWHNITLSLEADDLTRFRGEETASDVLKNVSQLRFLSHEDSAIAWGVDKISAKLIMDNITAMPYSQAAPVPIPASFWLMASAMTGLFKLSSQRSRKA